jgi:hypothetical protein
MNIDVIIRDCVDESEKDYNFVCFEFSLGNGYLINKKNLADRNIIGFVGGYKYIRYLPDSTHVIADLFAEFCPDYLMSPKVGVLWSKNEGLIMSVFKGEYFKLFYFSGIGYVTFGEHSMYMYFEHLDIYVFSGWTTYAKVMRHEKWYRMTQKKISIGNREYGGLQFYYSRSDDMTSPLEICSATLRVSHNVNIQLNHKTIWALRRVLRRRYRMLPWRKRSPAFNPVSDRSYTKEYIEFCYDLIKRNIDHFRSTVQRLI